MSKLILLVFLLVLQTQPVRADFFLHSWENHHTANSLTDISLSGNWYNSSSNFDKNAAIQVPSGLNNYTRVIGDLTVEHGFSDSFSIFGRLDVASVNVGTTLTPSSSFGLGDQTVGATSRLLGAAPMDASNRPPVFALDIQAQMDFPAYSTSATPGSTSPLQGDGSLDFTGGAFASFCVFSNGASNADVVVGAGYTYRTQSFSAQIPWSVAVGYHRVYDGFFGELLGYGFVSTNTDGNTNTLRSSAGSGGSYYTGDTNATVANIGAKLGYKMVNNFEFWIAGVQSIWGQLSPNAFNASLGIQLELGNPKNETTETELPILKTPKKYGHSNAGFVRYSLDSHVLKMNDRLSLIKIDKGSQDGVEVGQIFDVFAVNKDGSTGDAIARGQVTSVRPTSSAIEITEFFRETNIDEKFLAKRLIR